MKTKREFDKNTTLEVLNTIKEVKVSSDLKTRILHRLEKEKNTSNLKVVKLEPRVQWAAAIILLLLNATVLFYVFQSSQTQQESITDIDSFARVYNLSSDDSLYLN